MSRTWQLLCLLLVAVLAFLNAGVGASRVGSAVSTATGGRGLLVVPRGGVELKKYQQQQEQEGMDGDYDGQPEEAGGDYDGQEEDGDVDGGDFDQNDDAEPEEDNDNFEEEEEDEDRI